MGRRRRLASTIRLPRFYRRNPAAAVVLLVLLLLVVPGRLSTRGTAARAPAGSDVERYHDKVFTVLNVVDGDTIDIDAPDRKSPATRIRLLGVDTPEVAGAPQGEMYWGNKASAFTKSTMSHRRVRIELVESETRDKYDRLLAYVHDEESGGMLNEMLLRGGHAYADTRFRHPHRDEFRQIEADAKVEGIGLWGAVKPEQMPRWRQGKKR